MVQFLNFTLEVVVQQLKSDGMVGIELSVVVMVVGKKLVCHQLGFDTHIEGWGNLANRGCKFVNMGHIAIVGILPWH